MNMYTRLDHEEKHFSNIAEAAINYFIDFYCITTFEIIFYFFYIVEYTRRELLSSVDNAIASLPLMKYKTILESLMADVNMSTCDQAIDTNHNSELFMYCLIFVGVNSSILIGLIICELVHLRQREISWKKAVTLRSLLKVIPFIAVICVFEITFFMFVVSKYQITNNEDLICNAVETVNRTLAANPK